MNLNIKTLLRLTFITVLTLSILSGLILSWSYLHINRASERVETAQEMSWLIQELGSLVYEALLHPSQGRIQQQWGGTSRLIIIVLEKAELTFRDSRQRDALVETRKDIHFIQNAFNQLIRLTSQRKTSLSTHWKRVAMQIQVKARNVVRNAAWIIQDAQEQQQRAEQLTYWITGLNFTLLAAFVFVALFLANRRIARPIERLQNGVKIIASGNLAHRIEFSREDEFGQLTTAFNRMTRHLEESNARITQQLEELTAANRELQTFSHATAHNFKAPLRALSGFSTILVEEYGERIDETGLNYIQELQQAAQEMDQIIDGFLKLTRATSSGINRQRVNLSELARSILESHRMAEPGRPVTWDIAPGLTTHGDVTLLRTVLEVLLDNAWKFTGGRSDAHITFDSEHRNGETAYHVHDNGTGFDMAYTDQLFQPFQRLHGTTEFPGISLSLAIAHRIIVRHGGQIWAESEVDKWASFYFSVPEGAPINGQ